MLFRQVGKKKPPHRAWNTWDNTWVLAVKTKLNRKQSKHYLFIFVNHTWIIASLCSFPCIFLSVFQLLQCWENWNLSQKFFLSADLLLFFSLMCTPTRAFCNLAILISPFQHSIRAHLLICGLTKIFTPKSTYINFHNVSSFDSKCIQNRQFN